MTTTTQGSGARVSGERVTGALAGFIDTMPKTIIIVVNMMWPGCDVLLGRLQSQRDNARKCVSLPTADVGSLASPGPGGDDDVDC